MWISRVRRPIGISVWRNNSCCAVEAYTIKKSCASARRLFLRALLPWRARTRRWRRGQRRNLLDREALQTVSDLHVRKIRDADAAFKTLANFLGVVLEALQRIDAASKDHRRFANHAHFRVAPDNSFGHRTACNRAHALHAEGVAHFGPAQMLFLDDWRQQSSHGLLQFVQ